MTPSHLTMQVHAQFLLDEAYFRECFAQWLVQFSRYRRWQRALGAGALLLALVAGVGHWWPWQWWVLLAIIGVTEVLEFYWYRRRWLAARSAVRAGDPVPQAVRLQFDAEGLSHEGPTSHGRINWIGVRSVIATPGGLYLRIGDGISMYVPEAALSPADGKAQILQWFRHQLGAN